MKQDKTPEMLKSVVIRVASAPFRKITSAESFFSDLQNDGYFLQALYHANPLVYRTATSWFSGKLTDKKKIERIKHTLYNYYTRMYSNVVPYGFFSSVSTLEWKSGASSVELKRFIPAIRLDMELLHQLVNYFIQIEKVIATVKFYPNNTLYELGNQYRYVEPVVNGVKTVYRISGVESSDFLKNIFELSKKGVSITELAHTLKDEEYTFDIIYEFLAELVSAKLLIPELQLNISGEDTYSRLYSILSELPARGDDRFDAGLRALEDINAALSGLRENGNVQSAIEAITLACGKLNIAFNEKFCIQIDNLSVLEKNTLSSDLAEKLNKAVWAYSCFNQNDYKPYSETFKTRFIEKYEDASVPLLQALDTEAGISFGEFSFQSENLLLNNIVFQETQDSYLSRTAEGDRVRNLLYAKYWAACRANAFTIHLSEADFKDMEGSVDRLAPNYQMLFQVVDSEEGVLYLRTAGNSSGGALISRFAYANPKITEMMMEVARYEGEYYTDCIVAEIIHISDARIGNITFRPFFREYEIPVLTRSLMQDDFQVSLADLMVTVKGGKVILWSKKLRKRIIPKLTNAHNYNKQTTPVYQFLSEIAYQDILPSLYLDRGELQLIGTFVPRIQFESVILQPATWRFERADLEGLFSVIDKLTDEDIRAFVEKWRLPEFTIMADGGSDILVQWSSTVSVYYFLKSALAKGGSIFIDEYLYNPHTSLVKDNQGQVYLSECIALANNTLKPKEPGYYNRIDARYPEEVKRKFFPGDEWLYIKIYCGYNTADKLLKNEIGSLVETLKEQGLISKFFFIRFNDPNYHLRLRFKVNGQSHQQILDFCKSQFEYYMRNDFIWKLQEDTYTRELERYQYEAIDLSESIFEADSLFVIKIMENTQFAFNDIAPFLFIKGADLLLDGMGYSIEAKKDLLLSRQNSYAAEFSVGKKSSLKESLTQKETEYRKATTSILMGNYDGTPLDLADNNLEMIFKWRKETIERICQEYPGFPALKGQLDQLASSYIHMHAIRMFQDKPRQNELICYHLLHACYNKLSRILINTN